jgi:hypothetical protein
MELDFDKEIDALLRQTARSEQFAAVNGSNAPAHIDADAISALAENALPEKTRALYMTHLADCDRCRKILSNVIMLDQNAEVSASSSVAEVIGAVPVPWYRKLFLFPNLAYTMGALVLVFGGLLGFLVLRNSNLTTGTEVSQVANKAPAQPEYPAQEPAARTSNSVAASNTNTSVPAGAPNFHGTLDVEATPGPGLPIEEVKTGEDKNISRENPKGPPESTVDKLTERDDGTVLRKAETLSELQNKTANEPKPAMTGGQPAPAAAPPPPPAKTDARARDERVKDSDDKEKKKLSPFGSAASGRREVNGKTFSRVGSVWYDAAYQGQKTKDVRRGTNEYKKLDSGLRSIADTLGGTVVVVWRDGAYRIQ